MASENILICKIRLSLCCLVCTLYIVLMYSICMSGNLSCFSYVSNRNPRNFNYPLFFQKESLFSMIFEEQKCVHMYNVHSQIHPFEYFDLGSYLFQDSGYPVVLNCRYEVSFYSRFRCICKKKVPWLV